jgi:hypothetical protein
MSRKPPKSPFDFGFDEERVMFFSAGRSVEKILELEALGAMNCRQDSRRRIGE